MLNRILRAFTRENMPHKSLSSAVAVLIMISSGVGMADYKSKEEMLAALITAAISVILFFIEDKPAPKCEPAEGDSE